VLVVTRAATGLDPERERRLTREELDQATGGRATDPAFWSRCRHPRTQRLDEQPGVFTVFRIRP